jgi:hypothetical protein
MSRGSRVSSVPVSSVPVSYTPETLSCHLEYHIDTILSSDYTQLSDLDKSAKLYICIFQIIHTMSSMPVDTRADAGASARELSTSFTSQHPPFLQYLFFKSANASTDVRVSNNEVLLFPYLLRKNDSIESMKTRLENEVKKLTTKQFTTRGFLKKENNVYFFFDLGIQQQVIQQLDRKNPFWWGVIDEIVNHQSIVNFPVKPNIVDLFTYNKDLCYLYGVPIDGRISETHKSYGTIQIDIQSYGRKQVTMSSATTSGEKKEIYILDTPTIAYHGTYYKIIPRIATLGLQQSTYNSMMGPYYYFGTYRKAVRYAGWTSDYKPRLFINPENGEKERIGNYEGRYDKGGLVRFVIFLGNMKAFLNHPNDPEDYSEIVRDRIRENPRNKGWEMRTIRMHDHNGKWATEQGFDSVYVGKAKLDSGKPFMGNPEFIVKDFEQQIPLSYHYLDKRTLQRNWENDYEHYYIM